MDFFRLEGSNSYHKLFYPNACHVCKTVQGNLKSCSECHMIAYCSEKHKELHRSEHQELCETIRKLSKTRNLWNTRGMTSDEWLVFKKENVRIVKKELCRNLEPYEQQMFMFAKSCLICRQQTNLVTTCEKCHCVNSCADHSLGNVKHDCEGLLFSFKLDVEYFQNEEYIRHKLFNYKINMFSFPVNINSFVMRFGTDDIYNCRFWQPFDFYFCDWVSGPLTVCQIIQEPMFSYLARKLPFFVVHIIADSDSIDNWPAWELLLHMLADKVTLQITVLAAEAQNLYMPSRSLCKTCTRLGKSLSIKWRNASYEHYARTSLYDKPDLIVGFHAELRKFEKTTIEALSYQKCPVLLTAKSKSKASDNVNRLQEILGANNIPFTSAKNNFLSLRPHRDYENDCTFLHNKYLIICDSSNFSINLV